MSNEETLRFGIATPVVTLFRREDSWEENAGPAELREIALAADRLGFAHITCSEHVGIPTDVAPERGSRYYDPLATFGFLAAITKRVRFLTNVVVLPYHHPLAIAKRYGTLDLLCEGRLMLGVGVGSLESEFELLGAPFEERGDRYTDALRALRAAFGKSQPRYRGDHYAFSDFIIDPCGVQQDIPIWLGTGTETNVRLTAEIADGWIPLNFVPGTLDSYRAPIEEGFARAGGGKSWKDFEIRPMVTVVVTEDIRAALQMPKPNLALYVGGMGHKDKNFHKDMMVRRGYGEAAERIQELYLSGRKAEAAEAVPDEYIDEGALMGPPQRIRERFAEWEGSGATGLTVWSSSNEGMELLAELAGASGG